MASVTSLINAMYSANTDAICQILLTKPELLLEPIPDHILGWFPLHAAVSMNNDIVIALMLTLTNQIDVLHSQRAHYGYTPLHLATMYGYMDAFKRLLHAGANVHSLTDSHETPLFLAAKNNHSVFIPYLLENGARPLTKTSYGQTALDIAIINGHTSCCYFLFENKMTQQLLTEKDRIYYITLALKSHQYIIAHYMLSQSQLSPAGLETIRNTVESITDPLGKVLYIYTINHNADGIFKGLINQALRYPPNNYVFLIAFNFLHANRSQLARNYHDDYSEATNKLLTYTNPIEIINLLFLSNTTQTFQIIESLPTFTGTIDHHTWELILWAIRHDNIHALTTLIKYMGEAFVLNLQDVYGNSLLHLAVQYGAIQILVGLIGQYQVWPSPFLVNHAGETVLHYATRYQQLHCLAVLLSRYQLSPNVTNRETLHPLDIAEELGYGEIAKLLVQHQATLSQTRRAQPITPYQQRIRQTISEHAQLPKWPQPQPARIKYFVFEGGGVRGAAFYGGLQCLVEKNLLTLSELITVAGTSAGAITAFLFAIGNNLSEVKEILERLNFFDLLELHLRNEFFDMKDALSSPRGLEQLLGKNLYILMNEIKEIFTNGRGSQSELFNIIKNYQALFINLWLAETPAITAYLSKAAGVAHQFLFDIINTLLEKIGIHNSEYTKLKERIALVKPEIEILLQKLKPFIEQILTYQGIFAGEVLRKTFVKWITDKKLKPNITFSELHDLALSDSKYKNLIVAAYDRKNRKTQIFSYETTPNVAIAYAVRYSMSIHVFFYSDPDSIVEDGILYKLNNGIHYFDGGSLNNYILRYLDVEKFVHGYPHQGTQKLTNPYAMGIRLLDPQKYQHYTGQTQPSASSLHIDDPTTEKSMPQFLLDLFLSLFTFTTQENEFAQHEDEIQRTLFINTEDIGPVDFNLTNAQKRRLIHQGYQGGLEFCQRYRPPAPHEINVNKQRKEFEHYFQYVEQHGVDALIIYLQKDNFFIADIRDGQGNTFLHRAMSLGNASLVEILAPLFKLETVVNHAQMLPFDCVIYCQDSIAREKLITFGLRNQWSSLLLQRTTQSFITDKERADYLEAMAKSPATHASYTNRTPGMVSSTLFQQGFDRQGHHNSNASTSNDHTHAF